MTGEDQRPTPKDQRSKTKDQRPKIKDALVIGSRVKYKVVLWYCYCATTICCCCCSI